MAYERERIRKIVRMLESEHDGEAAAAARRLSFLAKNEGHNLDEMMAAVYGGGNKASGKGSSGFDHDGFYREARARAEAEEAVRRQREEQARRHQSQQRRPANALLNEALDLFEEIGPDPLTAWERDFMDDMRARGGGYATGEKQDEILRRIIGKYKRAQAERERREQEAHFWGRFT